jgi:tetratricopeptide (TPR) repeat protein
MLLTTGVLMLRNIFFFSILTMLFGNPLIALLIIAAVYLAVDARYFGVTKRLIGFVRDESAIRELKQQVAVNPSDATALKDLGRLCIRKKRYQTARRYLEQAIKRLEDSDEANFFLGFAYLMTGREDEGLSRINKSLAINDRLLYGEPYLRLGEYYLAHDKRAEALNMLNHFKEIHSSSSEGFYQLGRLYSKLGDHEKAREMFRKAYAVFKVSPWYKKKIDRPWAWKAWLKTKIG